MVNDVSERGVELIQEFFHSACAHDEELRQDILPGSKVFKSKINSKYMKKESCHLLFFDA